MTTAFIHRDQYRAGAVSEDERRVTTAEFFDNIFENPYTLCIRGAGNFSVRLYEVLASGRIPVLIKTDVKLPLQGHIPWETHCVIIDDPKTLVEDIERFHQSLSHEDFKTRQQNNRALWQSHLTRESYFCTLHDTLMQS